MTAAQFPCPTDGRTTAPESDPGEKCLDTRRRASQGFDCRMVVAERRGARLAKQLHEACEAEPKIVACGIRLDDEAEGAKSRSSRPPLKSEERKVDPSCGNWIPVRRGKGRLRGVPPSVVLDQDRRTLSKPYLRRNAASPSSSDSVIVPARPIGSVRSGEAPSGLNLCLYAPGGQLNRVEWTCGSDAAGMPSLTRPACAYGSGVRTARTT